MVPDPAEIGAFAQGKAYHVTANQTLPHDIMSSAWIMLLEVVVQNHW